MFNTATISILSGVLAIFAISIGFNIFNKVYQENYKKPWFFIAFAAVFLGLGHLLRFLTGFELLYVGTDFVTELVINILDFLALVIFTYALVLEYLILQYYKGKFVKMKFVPVQEGTLGGELDINVSEGNSYLALKKDRNFMLEQFAEATKSGFEGFLITETSPREIRTRYKLEKTPVAWVNAVSDEAKGASYIKNSLDESSDIVDPMKINNMITFIDNFLEQAQAPFIMLELGQILKNNNHTIVFEFLRYLNERIVKYNGILICTLNVDVLDEPEVVELEDILRKLD
ncbi:MAG: DUF835 domain-containing protein [Nanoarchaeota archaeon]